MIWLFEINTGKTDDLLFVMNESKCKHLLHMRMTNVVVRQKLPYK